MSRRRSSTAGPGTVKAERRATLSAEVGGRVAALPAKKGKRVRAGDVLLRVVDGDYQAQLAVQESALVSAKAAEREACQSAAQAARELARNENLARDQLVSLDDLDKLRTARDMSAASCDAARARVGQAAATVDAARVTLEKTVLKAPFDGVIADVTTEVGEWITPSPPGLPIPPVIEILDTSGIYVSAPLDEVDVAKVRTGLPVRITLDAYPGRSFAGVVTRVAPFVLDVKEQNRTFDVEAVFDDAAFAATLKPGLSADVTVVLRTVENVLRIPGYALLEGDHVLVLRGGRLVRVPVKTALKNWDFVEIDRRALGGGSRRRLARPGGSEGGRPGRDRRHAGPGEVIELQGLSRTYLVGDRPVHALRDVTLTVPDGDYVSVMGPSGSGKSTLLNVLGCLDRPDSGSYRLDGREVARLSDAELTLVRRHRIGFVFQTFHLVPRLSALGERRAADDLRGRGEGGARRAREEGARRRRPLAPRRAPPRAALRGGAAAGGDRAGRRHGAVDPPRRRADGESGHGFRRRDRATSGDDERRRPDARRRHPRPRHRRARPPPGPARGRRRGGGGAALRGDDLFRFAFSGLRGHRFRASLSLLGVAIGVASVIVLTSLGQGARDYVTGEFMGLGTNLLIVLPGKTTTTGMIPAIGGTTHDLTLADAEAIRRRVRQARYVAPIGIGTAPVKFGGKSRDATVFGTTWEMEPVRRFHVALGRYLPQGEAERAQSVCVLGAKIRTELFGAANPVGEILRIGEERYRVIGVMAPRGRGARVQLRRGGPHPHRPEHEDVQPAVDLPDADRGDLPRGDGGGEERGHLPHQGAPRGRGGHHGPHSGLSRLDLRQDPRRPHGGALRDRRDLPLGRRDPDHERHARLGVGKDTRDRASQGGRRGIGAGAGGLPRRGGAPFDLGRRGRTRRRDRYGPARLGRLPRLHRLTPALGRGGGSSGLARRRAPLRGAPGAAGFASRPGGGPFEALMSLRDLFRLAVASVAAHRLRSALTTLGIVVGIASVILLTSLGEGTRSYVLAEFSQFGTHLLSVTPGRVKTQGIPGAVGGTTHLLTVDDAGAMLRVPGVLKTVPVSFGTARVVARERARSVFVYGVTSDATEVWRYRVAQGRFLPPGDPSRGAPLAVLGPKLNRELFGEANPLGERIRIGGFRFLVIGVLEPKGQFLGFDIDDAAYIPVASARSLFGREDLVSIDTLFSPNLPVDRIVEGVKQLLMARHGGEEDFTITTQNEMLGVLDRVLSIVSFAIGGIGAISLLVGAIGILTMMWISVGERTAEIGLARAIGASRRQMLALFLLEAALLSVAGGLAGLAAGIGIGRLLSAFLPGLPFRTPPLFVILAMAVSLVVGLLSGVLPARRAASLDPIEALRAE